MVSVSMSSAHTLDGELEEKSSFRIIDKLMSERVMGGDSVLSSDVMDSEDME